MERPWNNKEVKPKLSDTIQGMQEEEIDWLSACQKYPFALQIRRKEPKRRPRIPRQKRFKLPTPLSPEEYLFNSARSRAKDKGLPFILSVKDIKIPEFCPILGIPLARSKRAVTAGSPSLDRTIPGLGYVSGNVRVISHRANTLKNNASADELRLVESYVASL